MIIKIILAVPLLAVILWAFNNTSANPEENTTSVSYTHLTLPTICSV